MAEMIKTPVIVETNQIENLINESRAKCIDKDGYSTGADKYIPSVKFDFKYKSKLI